MRYLRAGPVDSSVDMIVRKDASDPRADAFLRFLWLRNGYSLPERFGGALQSFWYVSNLTALRWIGRKWVYFLVKLGSFTRQIDDSDLADHCPTCGVPSRRTGDGAGRLKVQDRRANDF